MSPNTMNSLQRVTAAFAHESPDRTPVFEYVMQSPIVDYYLNRIYVADPSNWRQAVSDLGWSAAVRQAACDQVDLAVALGHDIIYTVPSEPIDDVAPTPIDAEEPEDRMAIRVERREAESDLLPAARLEIYPAVAAELRRRGLSIVMMAPTFTHGVWDDVDLMQTMLLEPEIAHQHFEQCTRRAIALAKFYAETGCKIIGVGGDFAGNRPLISPSAYRDFIVPEVRKTSEVCHALGCYAVNASDGNLWSVIDDFLVGCDVDGYIEIDQHAGMDLGKLRERFGRTHTFLGNLDCGNTLSFGTPKDVYQHVQACLNVGSDVRWGLGGHILTASNAITASVPIENYEAVRRAYTDHLYRL
ncbi:hypothetical protein GX645_00850 [Candidatus Sumerlaeota bacterium]|nr:hypothetical protein [Candidatus Sumerlaeota bacterium]